MLAKRQLSHLQIRHQTRAQEDNDLRNLPKKLERHPQNTWKIVFAVKAPVTLRSLALQDWAPHLLSRDPVLPSYPDRQEG